MADVNYSIAPPQFTPVAGMIQTPPRTSLSDVVNLASGLQAYKQGEISLTLEKQKEQERKRIQEFLAKPENFQTEGRIDINKLNAVIPNIAPLTGAEWMQKYTTLNNAQTTALQASQNLTQTQREMIASRLAIMGRLGVNEKSAYMGELDQLVKENPGNKDLKTLVGAYKTTLDVLPKDANLPQLAIAGANSLLSPAQQQQTFAPTPGTASTGAATFQTVTRPSVAGESPVVSVAQQPLVTAQMPPGTREVPTGQLDINNNPIVNVYDANGRFLGQRASTETPSEAQLPGSQMQRPVSQQSSPVGGMGMQPQMATNNTMPVSRMRPGETAQTLAQANEIRTNASNMAAQVPVQNFNNNQIIKLADDVITGKGANFVGALTGGYAGLPFTADNATNLNQLGHYMALQTASLAQSSGLGGTDAARGIAGNIAGTTEWTAPAIKHTARVNRALSTATDLFNQGVENSFKRTNDPFSARDFQNQWTRTVDINAVRLYDAMRNNDKEAIRQVVEQVGGLGSSGYKKLVDNIGKMQKLIRGQ